MKHIIIYSLIILVSVFFVTLMTCESGSLEENSKFNDKGSRTLVISGKIEGIPDYNGTSTTISDTTTTVTIVEKSDVKCMINTNSSRFTITAGGADIEDISVELLDKNGQKFTEIGLFTIAADIVIKKADNTASGHIRGERKITLAKTDKITLDGLKFNFSVN